MRVIDPLPAFPSKQVLAQFEGGAVYTAELAGKYYVITDESAMASMLDDEDMAGMQLVSCLEFETSAERSTYIAQRGWRAVP